jgi:hypothetical protein
LHFAPRHAAAIQQQATPHRLLRDVVAEVRASAQVLRDMTAMR